MKKLSSDKRILGILRIIILLRFLNEVQSVNRHLYIHQSGLDTSTPSGRMMFQIVWVFSEFESSIFDEKGVSFFRKNFGTDFGNIILNIIETTKRQIL